MRTCRSTTPHPAAIGVAMPCTRTSGHKGRHAFRHYGVTLHTWKRRTRRNTALVKGEEG